MINKLIEKIRKTNAPIVVGLDPMLGYVPKHILDKAVKEHGETLETLPLDVYTGYTDMFGEDVYQAISLETCLNNRAVVGGPSPKIEMENIHRINQKVSGYCD